MARPARRRRSFAPFCALSALLFLGCSSSEPAPVEDTGAPPIDAPVDSSDDALPDTSDDVMEAGDDADAADTSAPDADAADDAADASDATDAADATDATDDADANDVADADDANDGDAELACTTPSDCPGTDTDCLKRTCASSKCGVSYVASGTATSTQTTGDCKKNVCDGAGGITTQNDDLDVPVDANECTSDVCTAGVASNPNLASGTSCGGGSKVCDGNGACVQCTTASQCPGVDDECKTRTCNAGVCGVSYASTGTAVASQTVGDCKKNVCDGNGAIVATNDDLDLPVDGIECTSDVCTSGVPSNPPAPSGTACGAGGTSKCDGAGQCVGCITASECPGVDNECQARTCNAGVCGISYTSSGTTVANQTTGDCKKNVCNGSGGVVSSIDDTDVPVDGNQCTGDVCTAGVPSNPPVAAGTACAQNGGTQCDANAACVQCLTASECPGVDTECQVRTCVAGLCGFAGIAAGTLVSTQVPGDCQVNVCDGLGGVVSNVDDNDVPVDSLECTQDVCTGGVPSHPPVAGGTSCTENGGRFCDGAGACVACVAATDCGTDTACTINTCDAGVCGIAYTAVGTPLPSAQQTAGDCHLVECDGSGATISAVDDTDVPVDGKQCTDDVCTMGVPSNPNSPLGTLCTESSGTACNGAGLCVAQPAVSATAPVDGSTGTLANTSLAVTFSMAMNPSTLTAQTTAGACTGSIQVSLDDFATCIAFTSAAPTMSSSGTVAGLTPAPGLLVNRSYKIRVTAEARSAATGLPMAATYTQPTGFKTVSPTVCSGGAALVMSQVYPGGGSSTGTYKYDFVELHNRADYAINLSGLSLQYASATGTSWAPNALNGVVPPGGYFLVQLGSAGTGGAALPAPDATGSSSLGATSGKIALVSSVQSMPANTCPSASAIDAVVWGTSGTGVCTSPAPMGALSATTAAIRATNGCTYTGALADFSIGAPAPRNTGVTPVSCGCSATTLNESGASLEADFCNVQFPLSISVQTGAASPTVYGRIYESGVTPTGGAGAVKAQLGYGPLTANPEYQPGWTWASASYNASCTGCGDNDEYQASFTAPAAGSYGYAYRYSLDDGASWTYCDGNQGDFGAGSNSGLSFDFANVPVMTVTP